MPMLQKVSRYHVSIYRTTICLLLAVGAFSVSAQDGWITYVSDAEAGFSIDVPGDIVVKEKKVQTELGLMVTSTHVHQPADEHPNYLYVVNVVQYPDGTFPMDSVDLITDFLFSAVESINEGVSGNVLYKSDLSKRGDSRFSTFRIAFDESYNIIKGQVILANDTFYTLQVYTTRAHALNDEMDDFLDSFTLKRG